MTISIFLIRLFLVLITILSICAIYLLLQVMRLRKIVDHYKYEDEWAWPQYDRQGSWEDKYKGKLTLLDYISSLEREYEILGKILTNKIYNHVGHPFNERGNILRSVIRDLKLLYNQETGTEKFKRLVGEAQYEYTFWINQTQGKKTK